MLLAIDIGNTNILVGLFRGPKVVQSWRLSTRASMTGDEAMLLVAELLESAGILSEEIDGVAISSVVPELTASFEQGARRAFDLEPLVVGPSLEMDVKLCYAVLAEIGPDRIVNAVAAWDRYHGPSIVVDFGTATTLDVVTGDGRYVGGAICPGIMSGASELSRRAARLPRVEIKKPERALGRNTLESMQSGILYGAVGQVKELLARLTEELGEKPRVFITGGLADIVAPELDGVEVDRDLTIQGLRILYERNKKG